MKTYAHLMLVLNEDDDVVCGTATVGYVDREANTITCRLNGSSTKFNGGWAAWLAMEMKKAVKEIY